MQYGLPFVVVKEGFRAILSRQQCESASSLLKRALTVLDTPEHGDGYVWRVAVLSGRIMAVDELISQTTVRLFLHKVAI